jgi:hypothetical protein
MAQLDAGRIAGLLQKWALEFVDAASPALGNHSGGLAADLSQRRRGGATAARDGVVEPGLPRSRAEVRQSDGI